MKILDYVAGLAMYIGLINLIKNIRDYGNSWLNLLFFALFIGGLLYIISGETFRLYGKLERLVFDKKRNDRNGG